MDTKLITIATFNTPVEADLARNVLDAEGIQSTLADEAMVGNFWYLGNAVHGVKLLVKEEDGPRALDILDHHADRWETADESPDDDELSDTDGENLHDESPDDEADDESEDESDDDEAPASETDINDATALRAYRAAIIGLLTIFLPLLTAYSLFLLFPLSFQQRPLSARGMGHFYLAWLINIVGFGVLMAILFR